jgi:hypothetical protein
VVEEDFINILHRVAKSHHASASPSNAGQAVHLGRGRFVAQMRSA